MEERDETRNETSRYDDDDEDEDDEDVQDEGKERRRRRDKDDTKGRRRTEREGKGLDDKGRDTLEDDITTGDAETLLTLPPSLLLAVCAGKEGQAGRD